MLPLPPSYSSSGRFLGFDLLLRPQLVQYLVPPVAFLVQPSYASHEVQPPHLQVLAIRVGLW